MKAEGIKRQMHLKTDRTRALYKSKKYSRENQSSKYYVCGSKRNSYNLRLVINSRLCISLVAKLAVSELKGKLEVDPYYIRPLVNKLSDAVPLKMRDLIITACHYCLMSVYCLL